MTGVYVFVSLFLCLLLSSSVYLFSFDMGPEDLKVPCLSGEPFIDQALSPALDVQLEEFPCSLSIQKTVTPASFVTCTI